MNQEACQKFDERLNEVMDLRLDPNEDIELKAHALLCGECSELLGIFSELHTGLSGPNKIPIALMNSYDAADNRAADLRNAWINAIIIGALATLLFIGLTVGLGVDQVNGPTHVAVSKITETSAARENETTFRTQENKRQSAEMFNGGLAVLKPLKVSKAPKTSSFRDVRSQIQSSEIYQYSDDLPGLLPVRGAFDCCLEWLQESLFGVFEDSSESDERPDDMPLQQGCAGRAMAVRV